MLAAWTDVLADSSQYRRRCYVRAFFAYVEGFMSIIAATIRFEQERGAISLSRQDLALLLDETYSLNEQGKGHTRTSYPGFLSKFRFLLRLLPESHGIETAPDYGGTGWDAFVRALDVRHRVTHPKVSQDVDVSEAELSLLHEAAEWFVNAYNDTYLLSRIALLTRPHAPGDAPSGRVNSSVKCNARRGSAARGDHVSDA